VAAICVYCASSTVIEATHIELATAVGTELARRGHSLVSGGGRVSCMGAVARAARRGGARTVGVIPRALVEMEIADEDSDELVVVDDMRIRKGLMDARSDAFLTLPGGLGTLEELFEIWVARTLRMHSKPVVVLDPSGIYAPLREQVDALTRAGLRPDVGARRHRLDDDGRRCVRRHRRGAVDRFRGGAVGGGAARSRAVIRPGRAG
jgi:uncharacterized protein (TIGR00730 family)